MLKQVQHDEDYEWRDGQSFQKLECRYGLDVRAARPADAPPLGLDPSA